MLGIWDAAMEKAGTSLSRGSGPGRDAQMKGEVGFNSSVKSSREEPWTRSRVTVVVWGMGGHGLEIRSGIRDTKTRLAGGWWEFAGGKCTSTGWKRIEKAVDEAKIKWLEHGGFLANGGWMSCSDSLLRWWGGDKVPTGLGQDQRWGCGKQETLPCL